MVCQARGCGEVTVEVGKTGSDYDPFPEDGNDDRPHGGALLRVEDVPPRHMDWSVRRRCA